jgi:hypothetical protein
VRFFGGEIVANENDVSVTLPATVEKVLPARDAEPEKIQISVDGCDELFSELRVENTLKNESGDSRHFKKRRTHRSNHQRGFEGCGEKRIAIAARPSQLFVASSASRVEKIPDLRKKLVLPWLELFFRNSAEVDWPLVSWSHSRKLPFHRAPPGPAVTYCPGGTLLQLPVLR